MIVFEQNESQYKSSQHIKWNFSIKTNKIIKLTSLVILSEYMSHIIYIYINDCVETNESQHKSPSYK